LKSSCTASVRTLASTAKHRFDRSDFNLFHRQQERPPGYLVRHVPAED
jgi:hypothetical protein